MTTRHHTTQEIQDMTHTPGPWNLQGQWQLKTATGDWVDAECIEAPKWGAIGAWVDSSSDEREPNARLVAAAPELLHALAAAVSILSGWEATSRLDAGDTETVRLCKRALAKAEGRNE